MNQNSELQDELERLLNHVSEGMESEVVAIQKQIEQIKGLLVDAIEELHDSFAEVDKHSREQMDLFATFISDLVTVPETPVNIFQHVDQTEKALASMLEMLVAESRSDLSTLGRMSETVHSMNQEVRDEKKLAALLGKLDQQLAEPEPDLDQLRTMVAEATALNNAVVEKGEQLVKSCNQSRNAIERLAARDMQKVYAAKASVDEILDHLHRTNLLISDCRSEADRVNTELRQHLGSAVRALQFEDIVSQSLGHTQLHLERMDGFVSRMAKGVSELHEKGEHSEKEYAGKLGELRREMMDYRDNLRLEEINPVSQENLDEGDIELF